MHAQKQALWEVSQVQSFPHNKQSKEITMQIPRVITMTKKTAQTTTTDNVVKTGQHGQTNIRINNNNNSCIGETPGMNGKCIPDLTQSTEKTVNFSRQA
jgi:hypothetical protein